MAMLTKKAHTASNELLSCARSHMARPSRRVSMRTRSQFGLAALLAVAVFALTAQSYAQQSTTPSASTPPAATAPASQPAPASTSGSPAGTSDRPQFGVPNDSSPNNGQRIRPSAADQTARARVRSIRYSLAFRRPAQRRQAHLRLQAGQEGRQERQERRSQDRRAPVPRRGARPAHQEGQRG